MEQPNSHPPLEHLNPTCAVVISSCDAYADLWRPFFTLFWKHWEDCPYPVFLSTNNLDYPDPRVITLKAGAEAVWTARLRLQLQRIKTPYVLLCLEDFFFRKPVQTAHVEKCLAALRELRGHTMRLVCRPGPDRSVTGYSWLGSIDVGAPYRVSTQAALWKRESLLSLLDKEESIWEFEHQGSRRSDSFGTGFYCVTRDVFTYRHHVVQGGKWFPWEARKFAAAGIGCNFSARSVMTRSEALRWCVMKTKSLTLSLIPWRYRIRLVAAVKGTR